MNATEYFSIKRKLCDSGFDREIAWAEGLKPCKSADLFALEAGWVIMNSGMKEQVVRGIWAVMRDALISGQPIDDLFGHKLKVAAIKQIWADRESLFVAYRRSRDPLAFLETLPHIGPVTRYHLAKNLGMPVCKPDRHLVRISAPRSPDLFCAELSHHTGDTVMTVDTVIWRAANLGIIKP